MKLENKISVILPVYNSENYISESINSVLKQTYRNFELIVIDDGSTDNTIYECEQFLKIDKRVVLLKNSHKGLTATLNDGLKISSGKYIARQDADDISLPDRFEKQINWFLTNDKKVLCGTNCKIINDDYKYKSNRSISFKDYTIKNKLTYSNCFVHSSTMFLRKYAEKFGFYDENLKYAQDFDLWWKLSTVGIVGNLKDKLLIVRDRNNSVSRQNTNTQTLNFIKSCVKYYEFKKDIVDINENKKLDFYEKNILSKDKIILLQFLYNDKLDDKVMMKNLNFKQLIKLLNYPFLLFRKIFKILNI